MRIDPEALYVQLGRLVESMPDLNTGGLPYPRSTHEWLGHADALIEASGHVADLATFRTYAPALSQSMLQPSAAEDIKRTVFGALARAELYAPVAIRGSFIPAGNSFDAMAAIGKVLTDATQGALKTKRARTSMFYIG
jgi:hypothetical protein